ncbi:GLH-binding kinase 1 [Aphelenchoides bicaudatus]|nr:GLH-binding kinase 1 [Aphelenchoides bicaudatus]
MLANQHCTNSVDIWPVGVLLSEMILRRLFDFTRGNALNQLRDGTFMWDKIFNDKKFPAYDRKTESSFDRLKQALVCGRIKSTANQRDTNNSVKKCYVTSENARDLLKQLLKIDPAERISAQDALNHRFLKVWKKDDEINATPIEFSEEIGDCNLIGLDMKEHLLNKVNELADTFQKQNTVTV